MEEAAGRLAGFAAHTPVLEWAALNERAGGRVLIKPESLQRTGSFKFRGAYNRISQLDPAENAAGVVAFSSGNHAQGVAAAAKLCGLPAVIVMPDDAPRMKRENTEALGAQVVPYARDGGDRSLVAQKIADECGAVIVPPFDHPDTIAGQGTVGLELAQDLARDGVRLDALMVPCGGGGLVAGINLAMRELSPTTEVFAVEPAGFDDHVRSLASGERESNSQGIGSICDALLSPQPGALTFQINQVCLAGALAVTDDEVRDAVAYAWRVLKLVVEPGGAVGLAAVLSGKIETRERTTGIVLSGGNIDAVLHAEIIQW